MTRSAKRACLLRLGIGFGMLTALTGGSARAADGPLLVVVEAPPALDADAAEIRRAIGTELRSRTVAPMKTQAETSDRALIVALDRDRIAMSLRTSDAAPVARSIPSPPEHAARLRAIAWLAGNLARDQVSPILAEAPSKCRRWRRSRQRPPFRAPPSRRHPCRPRRHRPSHPRWRFRDNDDRDPGTRRRAGRPAALVNPRDGRTDNELSYLPQSRAALRVPAAARVVRAVFRMGRPGVSSRNTVREAAASSRAALSERLRGTERRRLRTTTHRRAGLRRFLAPSRPLDPRSHRRSGSRAGQVFGGSTVAT